VSQRENEGSTRRQRGRSRSVALTCSILLHGLIGALFLQTMGHGIAKIIPGASGGPGLAVSLVSAKSVPSRGTPAKATQRTPSKTQPTDPATPSPPSDTSPLSEGEAADASDAVAAPAAEFAPARPLAGSAVVDNGGGTKVSGLLAEVARCLPIGVRPHLDATLTLAADQNGNLTSAPTIAFSGPNSSKEDARLADLVVQAALQCGPYSDPMLKGQTAALRLDFREGLNAHAEADPSQAAPVAQITVRSRPAGAIAQPPGTIAGRAPSGRP